MKVEVKIPGVGESITEGTLASWTVSDGSAVIEGQAILEMETDKTTIDVTAPATGTLLISVPEGTDVEIDQVVAVVDTEAEPTVETDVSEGENPPALGEERDAPSADRSVTTPGETRQSAGKKEKAGSDSGPGGRISPAARSAAAENGLDPADLVGSGRDGLLTRTDVLKAKKSLAGESPEGGRQGEPAASSRPESRLESRSGEQRKPLSRIRKVIAANLKKTRDELVLLTTFNEADMSAVKTMRSLYGEAFRERHGVKLGFMSFFLKAASAALEIYPEVNARIDGNEVVYPDGIHISVAVSTPRGLVTPVVRHVEKKGFAAIEKEILGFSRKAEEKTLLPDDLAGGSFTITNGGIFGSMMSTPLPAPGQSAILGMHAIIDRPVVVDGEVVVRPMMYLALSYDHRLVDGREAVGCLKSIREFLEHPARLLLEL